MGGRTLLYFSNEQSCLYRLKFVFKKKACIVRTSRAQHMINEERFAVSETTIRTEEELFVHRSILLLYY